MVTLAVVPMNYRTDGHWIWSDSACRGSCGKTHMWLAGSTPDSRASWARALDAVAALEADTLIAGHRNPLAADDDARRQIGECRRYLADFEAALERSSAPAELIDRMTAAYPDLANPYTLWVAAYDLLGTRST
jgi:hypothetical protein